MYSNCSLTSKTEVFVETVNEFQLLNIFVKNSAEDVPLSSEDTGNLQPFMKKNVCNCVNGKVI